MDSINDGTHLIDANNNHKRGDNDEEEHVEYVNDTTLTEEEIEDLENVHPYLDHNFSSPTINSGLMTVHHNIPENFIDNPEYFRQNRS